MKLRGAACVAALALLAGAPVMAQDASPRPARAPGVDVERINKLMVGDRAPELAIGEWVKGDEVTGFEEGRVYVVEFWATWCGPCIAGMPHVSELQKEYKDKGVRVLGVNIWDDPTNVPGFMADRGAQPSGDELMQYTVAVEKKIEGGDVRNGVMAQSWMRDAGQNGIPSAFIVDQKGYIAWIGHPMRMDEPLKRVVAGDWDLAKAAKDAVAEAKSEKVLMDMQMAFRSGDTDKAAKLAATLLEGPAWDDSGMLNYMAWNFVDPDSSIGDRHIDLALRMAERAAELTEHKQAPVLDTLAWAYYHAGHRDKAVATQKKAVELAPEQAKAQYEAALERMRN